MNQTSLSRSDTYIIVFKAFLLPIGITTTTTTTTIQQQELNFVSYYYFHYANVFLIYLKGKVI